MSKRNIIIIAFAVIIIVIGLAWAFIESTKPLPGAVAFQFGRDHKPEDTILEYNSNPPTSGNHYPTWITKGFYAEPRYDGYLVHSQEHGYVILWYDCAAGKDTGLKIGQEPASGSAQMPGTMQMTQGSEGSPSALLEDLPAGFRDGSCDGLRNQIMTYISNNNHKLIGVPRVGMDHPIVLTAWGRKLTLDFFDKDKIKHFIDVFRDHGPEATIEP